MFKSISIIVSMLSILCGSVFAESDSAKVANRSVVIVGTITRDAFMGNDENQRRITFPVKTMNSRMTMCKTGLEPLNATNDFLLCTLLKGAEVKLFGAWSQYNEYFVIDSMRVDGEKFPRLLPK